MIGRESVRLSRLRKVCVACGRRRRFRVRVSKTTRTKKTDDRINSGREFEGRDENTVMNNNHSLRRRFQGTNILIDPSKDSFVTSRLSARDESKRQKSRKRRRIQARALVGRELHKKRSNRNAKSGFVETNIPALPQDGD